MKMRSGFVSNSSSSSFMVSTVGGMTQGDFVDEMKANGSPLEGIVCDIWRSIENNIEKAFCGADDVERFIDYWNDELCMLPDSKYHGKTRHEIVDMLEAGRRVLVGGFSDEDVSYNPMDAYLCVSGLKVETKRIWIHAEDGY